jgi:hypothetical protein
LDRETLLLVGFALGFVASGMLNDALRWAAERAAMQRPVVPFDVEEETRALFDRALDEAERSAQRRAHQKGRN